MSLFPKPLLVLRAATITVLVGAACANAEGGEPASDPQDPTTLPPGPDSGPPSVPDASRDAPTDAPPRTCSDDDFCHTILPENQAIQAVWSDGAGIAWAGTKFGAILRFDGTAWKIHASGLGEISSIWGSSPTEIWAAGAKGVYRGTGATSSAVVFADAPLEADADVHIMSLWGSSANDVWAVGARTDGVTPAGRVYHYTGATSGDGAPVWELDALSFEDASAYSRVWGSPGSGLWIVATQPFGEWGATQEAIVRRPPSSTKFEPVVLPEVDPNNPDVPTGQIFGAAVESDTSVWLALVTTWARRGVYHGMSSDGGATFTWTVMPYESDEMLDFTALAASPSGVWAAGKYGRLATWDGKTFAQVSTEVKPLPMIDPFFDVWTATGGEVWAVGKGIALHRAKK